MIRNDLKEKLSGKNLDELFLPNRKDIDQPGYRVGKIGNDVVVLNENTNEIMDFFYDDVPDQMWFSIGIVDPNFSDYCISRGGVIKNFDTKLTKKILTNQLTKSGYLEIKLSGKNTKFKKHFLIHRLLGYVFIPNLFSSENKIIDHIDRNRLNNNLENLRWVNIIENNKNLKKPDVNKSTVFFEYSDKDKTELVKTYTGKEIRERFKDDYRRFRKEVVRKKKIISMMEAIGVLKHRI